MSKYRIAEIFTSINGEGKRAGQLAVFVRFVGCNLRCLYCDTKWALVDSTKSKEFKTLDEEEILDYIEKSGIYNVTLTGGEPLLQKNLSKLIVRLLENKKINIEIETNGSLPIEKIKREIPYEKERERICFTVDYKLPASKEEDKMYLQNFHDVNENDLVKFVCSDKKDLEKTALVIENYKLAGRVPTYISMAFGEISGDEIVEFMKEKKLNNVNFQLQIHKYIWDPNEKGK